MSDPIREPGAGIREPDFVTIRNCHWLHEAQSVKSVLAAEGISAEIPDEQTAAVQPGIGAVRVVVRAEDAERAAKTLNAVLDRPTGAR